MTSKNNFNFVLCVDDPHEYQSEQGFDYAGWSIYEDLDDSYMYDSSIEQPEYDSVEDTFDSFHNFRQKTIYAEFYDDNNELVKYSAEIGTKWRSIWNACNELGKLRGGLIYIEGIKEHGNELELIYGN